MINAPSEVVNHFLSGLVSCHSTLVKLPHHNVILRHDYMESKKTKVSILCGGGSGHEPAHAGFVGNGLLTGAIAGAIFSSPSVPTILAAIRAVTGPQGTLVLIKNYTGDRLNFGMACERAKSEGLLVEMVIIGDDIATREGGRPRGIAGTVLIHKIASAVADEGRSLSEVAEVARRMVGRLDTLGVALDECNLPGKKVAEKRIGPQEIELGLGIHGEPGVKKMPMESAEKISVELMSQLWKARESSTDEFKVVLINNLGTTIPMELYIFADSVLKFLREKGANIERIYIGTFMSALDMNGVSVTLLSVPNSEKSQVLKYLDLPTNAIAWPSSYVSIPGREGTNSSQDSETTKEATPQTVLPSPENEFYLSLFRSVCEEIIKQGDHLNDLDRLVGDGDCGDTFKRGCQRIIQDSQLYQFQDPVKLTNQISDSISESMGGSSGAILEIFFRATSLKLSELLKTRAISPLVWIEAFIAGTESVQFYGGAKVGMRTLLDALIPALNVAQDLLKSGKSLAETLPSASTAAEKGMEDTKNMTAKVGRSAYLPQQMLLTHPDPGSVVVYIIFKMCTQLFQ
uniref:Dihydroxyacetone kinase n=1 Tax=Arcella intermedia TaxID=1963864 RepID=A0A6B2L0R9_9EUKA